MAWRNAFGGPNRSAAGRRPAYRPRLELLESRTLLSVYTVDRVTDANVLGGGQGAGLAGDLRYCITQAISGTDVITFAVTGTINLGGALPDLAHSVSIDGPGANLLTVRRDTGGAYRIFTVKFGRTVLLDGLTITNGEAFDGGGINNDHSTLTISDSIITGNLAQVSSGFSTAAGGISNTSGTLVIDNSVITDNTCDFAARDQYGGGVANSYGTVTISYSTLSGNICSYGDGIYTEYGSMTINNSTLSGNGGTFGYGGGIYNFHTGLTINSSTLAGNGAANGGAVYNTGPLTVSNSTISRNQAGGFGGGVSNLGIGTSLDLRNTILAGNTGGDLYGPLTSADHVLIGGNPELGPLQDNGGPTETMALLPYSLAIDAGDNTDAPRWDQRGPGYPRITVEDPVIDIGAVEYYHPPNPRLLPDAVLQVAGLPQTPAAPGSALSPECPPALPVLPAAAVLAGSVDGPATDPGPAAVASPRPVASGDPAVDGLDNPAPGFDELAGFQG